MFEYAVTTRKTRKPITKQHYLDYLDTLSDTVSVFNVHFETTKGLHMHYVIKSRLPLTKKSLYLQKYGWNHHMVTVWFKNGWTVYCRKDIEKNEDLNADIKFPYDFDRGSREEAKSPLTPKAHRVKLKKRLFLKV